MRRVGRLVDRHLVRFAYRLQQRVLALATKDGALKRPNVLNDRLWWEQAATQCL